MNNKTIIKVLIADDHPVFREGLKLLLETSGEIKIVGEAENGRQAVQLAKTLRPDVAILDVAMPLLNGLEAARQIVRDLPETRVLILSSYRNEDFLRTSFGNGVAGYVVKDSAPT